MRLVLFVFYYYYYYRWYFFFCCLRTATLGNMKFQVSRPQCRLSLLFRSLCVVNSHSAQTSWLRVITLFCVCPFPQTKSKRRNILEYISCRRRGKDWFKHPVPGVCPRAPGCHQGEPCYPAKQSLKCHITRKVNPNDEIKRRVRMGVGFISGGGGFLLVLLGLMIQDGAVLGFGSGLSAGEHKGHSRLDSLLIFVFFVSFSSCVGFI